LILEIMYKYIIEFMLKHIAFQFYTLIIWVNFM
jgi:hypothetical protein